VPRLDVLKSLEYGIFNIHSITRGCQKAVQLRKGKSKAALGPPINITFKLIGLVMSFARVFETRSDQSMDQFGYIKQV
jgi:hypothetical protein